MYTLKGKLKLKEETQVISDSFRKREFVIEDDSSQYAQTILFQVVQDRCSILDPFNVGDNVEVTFFLRGREWTSPKDGKVKYFNSLDAWKVELYAIPEGTDTRQSNSNSIVNDEDDLPF